MAENIQRWRPALCQTGCSFYQAVDTVTGAVRFITKAEADNLHRVNHAIRPQSVQDPASNPLDAIRFCPAHSAQGDTPARYLAVRSEFVREQTARAMIMSSVGAQFDDAKYSYVMKADTLPSVPGARVVQVSYAGLSTNQRSQLRGGIDLQFGTGQVEVA
jgi:hypothetical protein